MYTNKESCWYCTGARSFDIPCKGRSERHGICADFKGRFWIYTEKPQNYGVRVPFTFWETIQQNSAILQEKRALFWEHMNEGMKYEDRYDFMDTPMPDGRIWWGGRFIHLHNRPVAQNIGTQEDESSSSEEGVPPLEEADEDSED